MSNEKLLQVLGSSYQFKGDSILMGSAICGDGFQSSTQIRLPLKTMNRHGLISGATGTGKTKTLQVVAENLSNAGVPVLVMDIKGDLSGLGAPGSMNPVIESRANTIGMNWEGKAFPLEFLSISEEPGAKLRATVSEYGPVLLAKILDLNDNQSGILSMIFKYCDDRGLPLLDFKDLKSVLNYIQGEGKEEFKTEYGFAHTSSVGLIMRNIIKLEQQSANELFGEPSFDVFDLMQQTPAGEGIISVIRLTDMQSKPNLFSTFMLCLLAEIFQKMPELGDPKKPELVIFIDEAHLIFKNASKELLDQLEMTIKLIRSKGVGIFFVTQSPNDIPASILGQLGTKIQHALRAFTAKDRKAIKLAAENYPYSAFYQVDELITQIGIGEAFISTLDEKGRPTELVHTLIRPPYSRMDVLTAAEIERIHGKSEMIKKYNVDYDRESAYEILLERIEEKARRETYRSEPQETTSGRTSTRRTSTRSSRTTSTFEKILKSQVTTTIAREVARGLLGVLGLKSTTRRR
ncbi:helicase HerA-like domain-containing protein [Mariniphaga sp.]|uniref:helicase HerA-like domain-containing protein n=1 Tax=Mariniphaga sp. TaxID=1954475 RepID=UPI003561A7C6